MSLHFTNYPLDYVKLCFSDERWKVLEEIINEWIPATNSEGKNYKQLWVNPHTMMVMFSQDKPMEGQSSFDYQRKLVLQELFTDKEIDRINKDAMRMHQEKYTKERFEKGVKIPANKYDGPIFCQDGEYYMYGVEEYLELCEENENEPQEWVYGAEECWTLDEDMLYEMLSNNERGADLEDWEPTIGFPDYLEDTWKKYVSEYREMYYEVDYKKIIML